MMSIDNSTVKILIVDDTPANLEIAGKILDKDGYDIYIADSGQTALELVKNVQFDLILLDIMMPLMDGFETCKNIKAQPGQEIIPIIFLTAKAEIESIVKAFEFGAVDYIRKPFNALELLARVRTHVELKKIREELQNKNKKLEEAYADMEQIAMKDPLTRLFNRRAMLNKIEQEKVMFERNREAFAVIMSDIDFFKSVNDNYGHEGGDFILKSVADILKDGVRKQDFVARWGGEEFLILLPETLEEGAVILAERLRNRIEEECFRYNEKDIKITMTFGVSVFSDEVNIDQFINLADKALYKGKQSGRNKVVLA